MKTIEEILLRTIEVNDKWLANKIDRATWRNGLRETTKDLKAIDKTWRDLLNAWKERDK